MRLRFPLRKKEIVDKIQEKRRIRSENEDGLWKVKKRPILWKKICGKTTTELGRHQQGLLFAAEHKPKENSTEYLKANC
jgi:hypothetical protein